MALVNVAGFAGVGFDRNRMQQAAPQMPPIFEDILDTTAGADNTAALPDSVALLRIHAKGAVNIAIGVGAAALDGDAAAPASSAVSMVSGQIEYFTIQPGLGVRVSAITDA